MPKKNIFLLGLDLPDIEGIEKLQIDTNRSFLDADIVCIRPTLEDFIAVDDYNGKPLMAHSTSSRWRDIINTWTQRIKSALDAGKTIIFLIPEKEERYYYTGEKSYSGTGRNRHTTNLVLPCTNTSLIPIKFEKSEHSHGVSMTLDPRGEAVSKLWSEFSKHFRYNLIFEWKDSKPLVTTKSGNKIVGAMKNMTGHIILLPDINFDDFGVYKKDSDGEFEEDDDGSFIYTDVIFKITHKFRDAVFLTDEFLNSGRESTPIPDWSKIDKYKIDSETILEQEISSIDSRISSLLSEKDDIRQKLSKEIILRGLLFESGKLLENSVREALEILGFEAKGFKDSESEFDALFTSDEGRFLGEVEGKDSKAINVDKISQLQRNIAEDFSKPDITIISTGVLFGNAFRLSPLEERGPFFTEKVVQFAKVSNIALIRTTDLFFAAQHMKNFPNKDYSKDCRIAIASSPGSIVQFPEPPPLPIGSSKEIKEGSLPTEQPGE